MKRTAGKVTTTATMHATTQPATGTAEISQGSFLASGRTPDSNFPDSMFQKMNPVAVDRLRTAQTTHATVHQ